MLTQQQLEQFHRDGFINGGACLSEEEVDVLRTEVVRVIADKDNPNVPQPPVLHNAREVSDEQRAKFERIIAENKIPDTAEFASVRKFLRKHLGDDEAVVERLRRVLADSDNGNSEVWQIVNIWMASAPFRRLVEHPKITEEVAQLTDANELRVWHDQIQYKPAGNGGVNGWHQDAPAWPVLTPMNQVSAWVALDDVDETNGCMSMVSGSHAWGDQSLFLGRLPADFDAMPTSFDGHTVRVIRRPVRNGEVHYHHALTWHGSHANISGRPRRAIAIHYMPEGTRFVAAEEHVIKQFIDVPDGAPITGPNFPLCYSKKPTTTLA